MKPELQTVLAKLHQRGYTQAAIARELSETTQQHYKAELVTYALRYWVGHEKWTSLPCGKTLRVLLYASEIIKEPVAPVIRDAFSFNQQAA